MTELPPPTPDPQPMPPLPVPPFSWPAFIGGIVLALTIGLVLNLVSGLLGMASGSAPLALLIGAIPGLLLAGIGAMRRTAHPGFGTGLLVGGCIVALIGGTCGASMVGASFH